MNLQIVLKVLAVIFLLSFVISYFYNNSAQAITIEKQQQIDSDYFETK